MKITDGKRTVEITMHTFDGASLSPDWSSDFFEAGGLPVDNETEAYMVESVDYCVSMAEDWKYGRGDFLEDEEVEPDTRMVFVEDV